MIETGWVSAHARGRVARQLGTDHAKNRHWTPKHTQQRTPSNANSSASRLWPVHEPRSAGPQLHAHRKRVQPPSGLPFALIARVGSAVATCPAPPQRFPGSCFARSFASNRPSPPKRRSPAPEIRPAHTCQTVRGRQVGVTFSRPQRIAGWWREEVRRGAGGLCNVLAMVANGRWRRSAKQLPACHLVMVDCSRVVGERRRSGR